MVPNVDLNKIKFISCEYVPSYLFSHVVFTKITNECPLGYSARQATILYVYPLARYVIHLHTYPNKIQKKKLIPFAYILLNTSKLKELSHMCSYNHPSQNEVSTRGPQQNSTCY